MRFVDATAESRAPAVVRCAAFVLSLAWVNACSDTPGQSAKHLPRQGDAALVVYVDSEDSRRVEFTEEVEPNDQPGQATPLAPGNGARGMLDGETDVDLYRVELARDGHVRALVGGIENVDLILELMDESGAVLATSDRGPALVAEGIADFHVTAGRYHLAVREFVKKRPKPKKQRGKKAAETPAEGRQGPSPVYELVVETRHEIQPRREREPNDSHELASEILLGDQVAGHVGWARDTDVWKLSLEGFTSAYGLHIELSGVPGASMQLQVFDQRGNKVLERAADADKDAGLSVRNLVVAQPDLGADDAAPAPGSAGPGYYYVHVSARRSNPVDAYSLRMVTRLLEPDEEIEPNDEAKDAQPVDLSLDGSENVFRGYLTPSDVDRYALGAGAEPLALSVTCTPLSDIDVKLGVTVDGATLGESDAHKRAGKETLTQLRLEAGRTAIISVSGMGALEGEAGYRLSIAAEPASELEPARPGERGADDRLLDEYGE